MENYTPTNDTQISSIQPAIAFTLLTVSTIIVVENIIAIASVLRYGKPRNSPDIWVCSLSMVDILHSCIPCSIILYMFFSNSESFDISLRLCQVQGWFLVFLRITSCTVVAVMSCQQFLRIFFSSRFHEIWKQSNQIIIDVAIWIISAFVASLPLTEMGEFSPLKDTANLYCTAKTKTPFGMLLFSLLILLMVLTFVAILGSLVILRVVFNNSPTRFESFSSPKTTVSGKRKYKLIHERQNKILTKMIALVCSIFCICLLPRLILLFLDLVSVEAPSIYTLLSLQLPLISGLVNPLIYAIMWEPYRRCFYKLLACSGSRSFRHQSRSGSHTLNGPPLRREHSFWSTEFLKEDKPRAFDVLFGPSSVFKPLDFNNDELQLFDSSQSTIAGDDSTNVSPKALQGEIELESSMQLQSILDLIDEMVNRGIKTTAEESCVERDSENGNESVVNDFQFNYEEKRASSALSTDTCTTTDASTITVIQDCSAGQQCSENVPGGSMTSATVGCACLGRSKNYDLQNDNRYLNYQAQTKGLNMSDEVAVIEV